MQSFRVISFLTAFLISITGWSQMSKSLPGIWEGHYTTPNSRLSKKYISRLEVVSVTDSIFKGVIQTILPGDTAARIHYSFTGRIYHDYVMIKLKEVIYCKDPPGRFFWPKDCNECDSTKYIFKKTRKTIKLIGKRECALLCSIQAEYIKKYDFNSKQQPVLAVSDPKTDERRSDTSIVDSVKRIASDYAKRKNKIERTIAVNSDSVEIRVMDNGIIDDDRVTLIYNNVILISNLQLSEKPFIIKVPVNKEKPNTLLLYADNLGTIPPNTALVKIMTGTRIITMNIEYNLETNSCIELVFSGNKEVE